MEMVKISSTDIQRIINGLNSGESPLSRSKLSRVRMTARHLPGHVRPQTTLDIYMHLCEKEAEPRSQSSMTI